MKKRESELEKLLIRKIKNKDLSDIHDYIADLKKIDFSIIKTIGEIRKKLRIGLFEAQNIVLNSPTWIDEKQNFIDFNNKAWGVLKRGADKVTENEDGTVSVTFDLKKDDKINDTTIK